MNPKGRVREDLSEIFLNSAKGIIDEEGISGLSARKVGERAGYSYATIYNYYKDLKELIGKCAIDCLVTCYRSLESINLRGLSTIDRIKAQSKAYFRFFAMRPQWFEVVFIADLGELPKHHDEKIPFVGDLLIKNISLLVQEGVIKAESGEKLYNIITSSIHGKLLFFARNRSINSIEQEEVLIDVEIDLLLNKATF